MTQPIPGNNTAKASSSELQTLRFKFLFNSAALSLLLLCSTVCCCCSCANDTRLGGLDSSKCSLRISKAKKYKAALTTESAQAIWHSGFSVSSPLQGSWHLPGRQPPVRVPGLIPVPCGMQPPRSPVFPVFSSGGLRLPEQRVGLQSWVWGALKQSPVLERLKVSLAGVTT